MKSFIKFSSAVTAILVLFIAYSCNKENVQPVPTKQSNVTVENRSTGLCESAASTGCTAIYQDVTYYITEGTSAYPNCTFWINGRLRKCGNQVDFIYVNFGASIPNDPDCNQFDIDTDNPLIANQVIESVEAELIQAALIRASLPNPNDPIVTLPICGINPSIMTNLFQSACRKYCLVKDPKSELPGYYIVNLPCGNSCCQTTSELCFDPITGKVKITQISQNTPASPCTINSTELPCPRSTVFSTNCVPRCANIGQGG